MHTGSGDVQVQVQVGNLKLKLHAKFGLRVGECRDLYYSPASFFLSFLFTFTRHSSSAYDLFVSCQLCGSKPHEQAVDTIPTFDSSPRLGPTCQYGPWVLWLSNSPPPRFRSKRLVAGGTGP